MTTAAQKNETELNECIDHFQEEYPQLKILPPDINKSKGTYFAINDFEVLAPFVSLKGVGKRASEHLVEIQTTENIVRFLMAVNRSIVDSKTLDTLVENGAMRDFGENQYIRQEIRRFDKIRKITGKTNNVKAPLSKKVLF